MSSAWYYAIQAQKAGPVSWEEIERLERAGDVSPATLVWRKGMTDWRPLREVSPTKTSAPEPPPLKSPPVASANVAPPPAAHVSPQTSTTPTSRRRHAPPNQLSISPGAAIAALLVVAILAGGGVFVAINLTSGNQSVSPVASQQNKSVVVAKNQPYESPMVNDSTVESEEKRPTETPIESPEFIEPILEATDPPSPEPTKSQHQISKDPVAEPTETTDPVPAEPTPRPQPAQQAQKTDWPWQNSQLFQEVNVRRKPSFTMIGRPVAMSQAYQILSTLDVGEPNDDGSLPITQTVIATRLNSADDLSRSAMQADLTNLKDRTFTYRFHPGHGVVDFKRKAGKIKPAEVKTESVEGMFAGAAMDDDGWRELAHLTFLQPPEPLAQGVAWRRQIHHAWGSLGAWSGDTDFRFHGHRQDSDWVAYQHTMTWKPPAGGAKASILNISTAKFAATKSQGVIQYDPKQKRVLAAEETFEVGGSMNAEMAGQAIAIEMTETQTMGIRILDQNPWRQ